MKTYNNTYKTYVTAYNDLYNNLYKNLLGIVHPFRNLVKAPRARIRTENCRMFPIRLLELPIKPRGFKNNHKLFKHLLVYAQRLIVVNKMISFENSNLKC